jgi:acetoacetate decarboxylase
VGGTQVQLKLGPKQEAQALPAGCCIGYNTATMTMPFDNPTFTVSTVTFGRRRGITLVTETDSELVRSLVPAPLTAVGSQLLIQQHVNTITSPTEVSYPNATIAVPASLNGREGFYISRIYEGSDEATMLTVWGREIWGFPKIAAKVAVSETGAQVTATNASMDIQIETEAVATMEPQGNLTLFCRKTIPSADCAGFDIDRIVEVPIISASEKRFTARVTRCEIEIDRGGAAMNLPIHEHVAAFRMEQEAGTVIEKGIVVHDYLA